MTTQTSQTRRPSGLSVQLYTLRERLASDFDGTLAAVAAAGFTQVEPFGLLDFRDQLTAGLPAHGLTAPTTHMSLTKADPAEVFAAAAELGVGTVIDPAIDPQRWTSEDGIAGIAEELNTAAQTAAAHGVQVGYHNHWFEVEQDFGGRTGLDVLADHLDPAVVLEVDTYWAVVGGVDAPELLRRLGDRVVALHIKDGDGTRETKNQVAVGQGSMPIWDIIAANPAALRVVELDDSSGDMLTAVQESFTYLTKEN